MKTAAVWKRRGCIAVLLLLLIGSYVFSRNLEWVNSENSRDISPEKAPFPADGGREAVTVALEEVKCFRFEDTVKVQGSLKSKNYALVSSRTDNLIEEIFVREGDHVVGDETKLFRLDSLRLEKEVQIARRDLQAARFSVQEKMANLRKTEVELYKAELDYNRYRTLYEESAVSKSAFEDEQSR